MDASLREAIQEEVCGMPNEVMHAYEVWQTLELEVLAESAEDAATQVMDAQRVQNESHEIDPDPAVLYRVLGVHVKTKGAADQDETYATSPN